MENSSGKPFYKSYKLKVTIRRKANIRDEEWKIFFKYFSCLFDVHFHVFISSELLLFFIDTHMKCFINDLIIYFYIASYLSRPVVHARSFRTKQAAIPLDVKAFHQLLLPFTMKIPRVMLGIVVSTVGKRVSFLFFGEKSWESSFVKNSHKLIGMACFVRVTSITHKCISIMIWIFHAFHSLTVICLWISPLFSALTFLLHVSFPLSSIEWFYFYFCFHHALHDSRRRMLQLSFTQLTHNRVESLLVILSSLFSVDLIQLKQWNEKKNERICFFRFVERFCRAQRFVVHENLLI